MPVPPIPPGYPRVSPYLVVAEAKAALAWYVEALGGTETMRIPGPDGGVSHAEIRFADSVVMVGEMPGGPAAQPTPPVPSVSIVMYVEDVDAAFARAVAAGATAEAPVEDKPYGDRMGGFLDPFGHRWYLASHVEDVTPEEIVRRMSSAR